MSSLATPYGLRPLNQLGGTPYSGALREYKVAANNAAAIFHGDLVVLSSAGLPSAVSVTPVAQDLQATSTAGTAGIIGVMHGCRYVNSLGMVIYQHYLPANTITGGGSDVWIQVVDDDRALFQILGTAALGTFNSGTGGSGWPGAIGKNAALDFNTAGSTVTGNSGVRLLVGTNGASIATTTTLAMRIVDVVRGTDGDTYPEFIVKYNMGLHNYQNALGV